ncbi:MAG: tRNA (N6-isopentenyl adenosine(37)-C2)-methylthiotransferase MiaB [Acidobacteriota bacterium]|jgi:tRNA-2-methylthio-N6-dimethylallyladenosine synthase|nr:tRNA (N6-isopentenyl adenosine(37)-C2)-methylthiotransferase MiaB [Acidobacteriota bacterium]
MARKYWIETFGCQMNALDSEKIAGDFQRHGMVPADGLDDADVVALNTCSVRDKAVQKAYARLGELKRRKAARPGMTVCVLGCMAQLEGGKILVRAPYVNIVAGPQQGHVIGDLVERSRRTSAPVLALRSDEEPSPLENGHISRETAWRASVTISEGCNRRCAFCVVPATRGPERHRASAGVVGEVAGLVGKGCVEVLLLGQTVNSYVDPSDPSVNFAELLRRLAKVEGLRRIRFTSPHPNYFTDELLDVLATTPAVCNQVHLPVQSGSTKVLRAMRRGYTREGYLGVVRKIHALPRPVAISTDLIVGYPGETEADFDDTLTLLDLAQYDGAFSFKYSPRPHTAAYELSDDVADEEKGRRLEVLQARQRDIQAQRNAAWVGRRVEVLVEARARSRVRLAGRTTDNKIVNFDGPDDLIGSFAQVEVTGSSPNSLKGILMDGTVGA